MSDNPEMTTAVEVKGGKVRTVLTAGTFTVLLFLAGYATLWADRHNDERYISKEEYHKDRENDQRMAAQIQATLAWRMDQTDKKLDEISHDIKALLSRPMPANNNHNEN